MNGVRSDGAVWVELFDALELALFEACDGTASVLDLVDRFADNGASPETDTDSQGEMEGGVESTVAEGEAESGRRARPGGVDDQDDEGEGDVTEDDVLVRLRRLWEATLVEL